MNIKNLLTEFIRIVYIHITLKFNQKPRLRAIVYNLYDKIRLLEYKLKSSLYKELAQNNIIYVKPERITYEKDLNQNNWRLIYKFIKPLINPRFADTIQLVDGDWDLKENLRFFNDDIKHVSYYLHFIKKIDWKDTPYYKREVKRYLNGVVRKEYKSLNDLDLKFKYHDQLFEKIKLEGFKTQHEIIKSKGITINYGRGSIIRKEDDDITIGIGRYGDKIFFDGRHRLNIAKLLKLEKIPVRILVAHPDFMKRFKIKND